MEHLSFYGSSVRGTCRGRSFAGGPEGYDGYLSSWRLRLGNLGWAHLPRTMTDG